MANIRIKDLSTTASSTASDDFFGVDGATNGTRKLSAYSPTFGGNLTVSGTGGVILNATDAILKTTDSASKRPTILAGVTESAGVYTAQSATPVLAKAAGDVGVYVIYADSGKTVGNTYTPTSQLTVSSTATTLAGNLTVSGGTITSGTGTLTLNSSANTVVLQSAGTTALTLDSSQNATFAGTVTLAKSQDARTLLTVSNDNSGSSAQSALRLITASNTWYVQAERNNDQFAIIQSSSDALRFDSSRNATFSGTIATQGGTASTPASASATGTAGTIKWDASYIYVCTASNTWKRVAIATW